MLNASGRIGSLLPPLLFTFVEDGGYLVFLGMMALVASGLIWLLPETKNVEMMDSLEDGENFNRQCGGLKWIWKGIEK